MPRLSFKKKQKIRVIFRDVMIFTTVGKFPETFGNPKMVDATYAALIDLQTNGGTGIVLGNYGLLGGTGEQIQVDLLD